VPPHALVQGKVPTIFQFDLRDPATFFAAQAFPMQDHDLLYITNAPSVELGKVLNLVGQIAYPFTTLQTMGVIK
jgi:polysaccharide export outer membrane protein